MPLVVERGTTLVFSASKQDSVAVGVIV